MRKWIDILNEGDVVSLAQHKSQKAADEYAGGLNDVLQGEAAFFADGKFLPFAQSYIESGYDAAAKPKLYVNVSFRDYRLTPGAKEVLADLRRRRFTVDRTKYHKDFSGDKTGPWAYKEITFEEARELFLGRENSKLGAYQPSRLGFRNSRQDNFNDDGVGFMVSVAGLDHRRPGKYASETSRPEEHVVDNPKDWQEVADMMAMINRSRMQSTSAIAADQTPKAPTKAPVEDPASPRFPGF